MNLAVLGLLAGGFAVLLLGGNLLVQGASKLARSLGLSPLVIGLTVVALGTSAPEMATSVSAALSGEGDMAFGNVVGSNILNVLLILGVSAAIMPLAIARRLVRIDVPIMVALSVAVLPVGRDGRVTPMEGAVFLTVLVAYILYRVSVARSEQAQTNDAQKIDEVRPARRAPAGLFACIGSVALGLCLLALGSR